MEEDDIQKITSKKEAFLNRQKERYPDSNFEDEEELFGKINDDYDAYDEKISRSSENEEKIANLFNKDPRSASFLMNWKDGKDPLISLIEEFGDDFREALENPEMKDKFAESHAKYLERQTKNKSLQEQAQKNLTDALQNLELAQKELGCSEEVADKAFKLFDKVQDDAIINKIDKETWCFFIKGVTHDEDVQLANHEGEIKGRNAKIDINKKKQTVPYEIPPTLSGNSKTNEEGKSVRNLGAIDRYADDSADIFNRGGGIKRKR
ncbi:MAG: hypothetical protein RR280_07455 [Bacteroidaceae bacterium]